VNGATFSSLGALKRRLLEQHKLHFCDLCIKGRKVRRVYGSTQWILGQLAVNR
jgi:hypothetical protein